MITVSAIAAISKNRVLGKDGKLIWAIPEDHQRFKQLTSGHPIIMGRKTFESIGRALPNRTNIVVTRDASFQAPGCIVVHNLEEALEKAGQVEDREIFIIGGGQLYAEALPFTQKLYLTIVNQEAEGDAYFPDYSEFTEVLSEEEKEWEGIQYAFTDLQRKENPA